MFVTCLNRDNESKGKPIEYYLDLFVNTSLNHMYIRSRLVTQPKNKSISNREQSINATDLYPIAFGIILPPKLRGKISTNSQNNKVTSDENKNSKVCTIRLLLDSCAIVLIILKDVLYKHHKIVKVKENKWSTMAGTLNTTFVQKQY